MFDSFTTRLVVEAACLMGSLTIFSFWLKDRHTSAHLWWIAGFGLFGLGLILGSLRQHLPALLSYPVPGLLTLLGVSAFWAGLRAFDRRPFPLLALLPPAIWGLGLPLVLSSYPLRYALFNLAIGTATLLTGTDVWRQAPKGINPRTCIGFICLLETAISYTQAVALIAMQEVIGDGPLFGWLTFAPFQSAVALIALVIFGIQLISERSQQRLQRLAMSDELTNVLNRRGFFELGQQALRGQSDNAGDSSVIVFDIDRFKSINDTYGHAAGDQVIATFAKRAARLLRPDDIFGRIGGEEFALLLPGTPSDVAASVAERIRLAISEEPITGEGYTVSVTTSAGLTSAPNSHAHLDRLMATADAALYEAKRLGRNRIKSLDSLPSGLRHLTPIARVPHKA
ncbi:putative diguanylate cyclase YcdT [Methyloligella halotolerans]|uniref:diguanylate cyclase n=1 Tax=Methyloligella halotolerans TaxID=1177755 RepID=A0A1E2RX39_9HYPH|nr:GGDEF domain-containing protein [Methyloligella halotolerans]ODA66807.1 putative diguanylate cyclase YcdT [Methyloligella halotolerans]